MREPLLLNATGYELRIDIGVIARADEASTEHYQAVGEVLYIVPDGSIAKRKQLKLALAPNVAALAKSIAEAITLFGKEADFEMPF